MKGREGGPGGSIPAGGGVEIKRTAGVNPALPPPPGPPPPPPPPYAP
ncbi:MAG: hypothetical protein IPP22_06650 [Nitrosomonas sp.]|nr:hypothetical protein [Nitrosomonas sp.]